MSYTPEEIQAAGLDDFRQFLRQVWAFLGLPEPTPVQLDIAWHLQHGPRRTIVQGFRGVGKSWITVAFVLWNLLLDPQKKIMVVSANQSLADDFSKFCKQLINGMPMLQHLKSRMDQRDSAISFDVGPATPSKDPSVKSAGITGQLTGSRADLIVGDDIEVPKNSQTHTLRLRLAELVKEFDALLKPEGRIVYLGTPQIEDTLYTKLEERGYKCFVWPVEVPVKVDVYRGRLAPHIIKLIEAGYPAGYSVEPTRFPKEDLDERRASFGLGGYALQFMLDTSPADAERHPLKCSNFIVMDLDGDLAHVKMVWGRDRESPIQDLPCGGLHGDMFLRPSFKSPEMAKYTGTVMAIDPSGRGNDETAYAIVKYLYGMLFVMEIGGFRDGFAETTLLGLAAAAKRWGVNDIIIEQNYGGGMFDQLFKPVLQRSGSGRILTDEDWDGWSSTQKENRICDILQPVLASHRLVMRRGVIEEDNKVLSETPRYSFVQQLTRMERVKGCLPNEDRLEALSMAVSYWTSKMDRDKDRAVEKHKETLLDQELAEFAKLFGGDHARNHNWRPRIGGLS